MYGRFQEAAGSKGKPKPINPRDIFNSLPKPPGINDLYASQAEVLDAWFPRRTDRDVVVKLHTGGGKTLVALLMAQSVMNETGRARDLSRADQPTRRSGHRQEPGVRDPDCAICHGQPLAARVLRRQGVLVGAYETLFNGRSKFGVRNSGQDVVKAGAIILDDAHVALSSVREAFSLTISAKEHTEVYADLAGRFRPAFKEVGRSGSFADITNGKDYGVMEVPSWAWHRKLPEVEQYLVQQCRRDRSLCLAVPARQPRRLPLPVQPRSATITPIFPPVDLLPTFEDCRRRIYMSATIADDSEIVRAFGASADAVAKPITSTSLAGVGERMILIPS